MTRALPQSTSPIPLGLLSGVDSCCKSSLATLPAFLSTVMGRSKTYTSPSKKYRSVLRLANFLRHKLELQIKPKLTSSHQLCLSIPSVTRNLNSMIVSNLNIPPQPCIIDPTLVKLKPPKPKLSVMITSNTCDTPACYNRRRPCHALNPPSQDYFN